jgi:hypothetical protein
MGKFTDMAGGKIVVRKEVGAEEELDRFLEYITWNSVINLVKLFNSRIVFFLLNGGGRLGTFSSCEFTGCTHPIWMIQGMFDMTSPFVSRAVLEIDGNMSWRDGIVETRDWTEPDLCGCRRERLEVWSEENAVSGLVEGLVEGS